MGAALLAVEIAAIGIASGAGNEGDFLECLLVAAHGAVRPV